MMPMDRDIEHRISALRDVVREWAVRHDLWEDTMFRSYQEHFQEAPERPPVAQLLLTDNELMSDVLNEMAPGSSALLEQLDADLSRLKFYREAYDLCTTKFCPSTNETDFYDYFQFKWLCSLIAPSLVDVNSELFEHFRDRPDDLHRVEPRAFEVLIDAMFRNNGFRTELGSGSADGGVDVRLFHHDVVGELTTLVQIKRYAKNRPIKMDAVASLAGVVADERANRGLFVTTSRFLPSARKFASRQNRLIALADTTDMIRWCNDAAAALSRYRKPAWAEEVLRISKLGDGKDGGLVGRIVCAQWGHGMILNDCAMIVRDSPGAVLLVALKRVLTTDDGYNQFGYEKPVLELADPEADAFVAMKSTSDQALGPSFCARKKTYHLWNGEPLHFNTMD